METSNALQEQVKTLEEYIGVYNTIKGSINTNGGDGSGADLSDIEFYGDNVIKALISMQHILIDCWVHILLTTKIYATRLKKLCRR